MSFAAATCSACGLRTEHRPMRIYHHPPIRIDAGTEIEAERTAYGERECLHPLCVQRIGIFDWHGQSNTITNCYGPLVSLPPQRAMLGSIGAFRRSADRKTVVGQPNSRRLRQSAGIVRRAISRTRSRRD